MTPGKPAIPALANPAAEALPADPAARLLLCSCPDRASAERIARHWVEQRLAACVSLLPGVRSIYRWQGAVEHSDEVLLLAKTAADRVAELNRTLREWHPYELPELLVVDVASGLPAYLAWVVAETRPTISPPAAPATD